MLKRGTLLLLVSAIALLGGVLLFEGDRNRTATGENSEQDTNYALSSEGQENGELIFPFAEEDVDTLTVERSADTVAFEKSETGIWQMTKPENGLAEPGAIAFLLTQLTNPSTNTLTVPADTLSDFGLDRPTSTVSLTANDVRYQLAVGTADFTGDQLYVQATAPEDDSAGASDIKIHLVSGGFDNAVNRPTEDWLAAEESEETEAESKEGSTRQLTDRSGASEQLSVIQQFDSILTAFISSKSSVFLISNLNYQDCAHHRQ